MDRPRLDDPSEYKIVKQMYFHNDIIINDEIDSIEKLERMESRSKNNNKNSR